MKCNPVKLAIAVLCAATVFGFSGLMAQAAEFTVTDVSDVLWTNGNTVILTDADDSAVFMSEIEADLPILVTGITSNGYFRIDLAGTPFYINGIGLSAVSTEQAAKAQQEQEAASYTDEVVRLVNVERSKEGLSALSANSALTDAANARAREVSEYFSHTRPNGSRCFTILEEYGISYRGAGENIAQGYLSAESVVDGWMHSEGHRANILNSGFNSIGVGYYNNSWVQLFLS